MAQRPTNNEFIRHQQIVDNGDPFLVEHLQTKSDEELQKYFEKVQKDFDILCRGDNDVAKRDAHQRISIVASFIELKRLYKELRNEMEGKGTSGKGVSFV